MSASGRMRVAVTGASLWTPGYASLEAWLAGGAPDPSETEPACAIASSRAKRGTSRLTRMLGHVVDRACADAGADLDTVSTVYASAWGELETTIALLDPIYDGDVGLSPLRFKHSVHNAASGLVSIATGDRAFSTAIAGGLHTVEQGLIEAMARLAASPDEVVVLAMGDDRLLPPFDRFGRHEGLAAGLVLTTEPGEAPVRAWLEGPARLDAPPAVDIAPAFADNPCAHAVPLMRAIGASGGVVPLSGGPRPWSITVEPGGRE